jgi:hypothetical protein
MQQHNSSFNKNVSQFFFFFPMHAQLLLYSQRFAILEERVVEFESYVMISVGFTNTHVAADLA